MYRERYVSCMPKNNSSYLREGQQESGEQRRLKWKGLTGDFHFFFTISI